MNTLAMLGVVLCLLVAAFVAVNAAVVAGCWIYDHLPARPSRVPTEEQP